MKTVDAYWTWCQETPCVSTVPVFAHLHDLSDDEFVELRKWVVEAEFQGCHPTREAFYGCRDGTRTDCHWCNNHK
jgi:hypothetical protein